MGNPKMLLKLLTLHLQADAPSAPVRKILLAAEAARPRVSQGGLFCPISPDPEKVELTLARLAKLVGAANIGSPELLDTHRPEGFRMRRFVPNPDAADIRRPIRRSPAGAVPIADAAPGFSPAHAPLKGGATFKLGQHPPAQKDALRKEAAPNSADEGCKTAFRVFRPALPARVEVRQGCPARVAFPGIRGRVVAASGPWRGSGDWWSEDAWQSEEWDIEIHFDAPSASRLPEQIENTGVKGGPQRGVYRLFYDLTRQEWFVRGVYD
jgi:protein ImuB